MSSVTIRPSNPIPGATLTSVLLAVVVITALYFGREVLVPIALAVLLSFVLAPLVRFLQAWFVPRILAVVGVTLLALVVALGLAALMVAQVNQLASELPRYEFTLREKIHSLRGVLAGTGTLERASEMLRGLRKEIERSGDLCRLLHHREASKQLQHDQFRSRLGSRTPERCRRWSPSSRH